MKEIRNLYKEIENLFIKSKGSAKGGWNKGDQEDCKIAIRDCRSEWDSNNATTETIHQESAACKELALETLNNSWDITEPETGLDSLCQFKRDICACELDERKKLCNLQSSIAFCVENHQNGGEDCRDKYIQRFGHSVIEPCEDWNGLNPERLSEIPECADACVFCGGGQDLECPHGIRPEKPDMCDFGLLDDLKNIIKEGSRLVDGDLLFRPNPGGLLKKGYDNCIAGSFGDRCKECRCIDELAKKLKTLFNIYKTLCKEYCDDAGSIECLKLGTGKWWKDFSLDGCLEEAGCSKDEFENITTTSVPPDPNHYIRKEI